MNSCLCWSGRHETEVADQLRHPPRRGPQHDLIGFADLEQFAAIEHGQAVGEGLGVGELVSDQHGGHGPLRHQGTHQVGEGPAQAGVQSGVGLVEQQGVAVGEQQAP